MKDVGSGTFQFSEGLLMLVVIPFMCASLNAVQTSVLQVLFGDFL
jgi:hypothetical protein